MKGKDMKKIFILMLIMTSILIAQPKRTMLDVNNSSSTVLDSAAVYTGAITNALKNGNWTSIAVSAYANHSSGVSGTLVIRFGTDGTNWITENSITITTDTEHAPYVFPLTSRYYQVVYTNGGEVQTEFRLEAILFEEDLSVSNAVDSLLANSVGAYNPTLGADEVIVLNGPQYHYTSTNEIETFTNLDTDSTQTVFDAQSYPTWTLHLLASGGVNYRIYITDIVGASDTDPHDGNWINYSLAVLTAAAGLTDVNHMAIQDTPLRVLKIMVVAATTDATNSFSATLIKGG